MNLSADTPKFTRLSWLMMLGLVGVWIFHGIHTYWLLGGRDLLTSGQPIMVHDHPFVWHNAVVGALGLRQRAVAEVYDPHFMAGYLNSFVGSTNPFAAWWVLLAGDADAGRAYNLHALTSIQFLPLLLTLAAWLIGIRPAGLLLVNGLWVLQFWGGYSLSLYVSFGMIAFVTGAGWWMLAVVGISRFLSTPTWPNAFILGITTGLACLTHLSMPVLLAPIALVGVIVHWPGRLRSVWLQLLSAVVLCMIINWSWLGSMLSVWGTLGRPPVFFINANIVQRLQELFIEGRHVPLLGLGLGIWGAWEFLRRRPAPLGLLVACSLGWAFFLAIFAGHWSIFHLLEPGRHTLTFANWCCLAAGGVTLRPLTRNSAVLLGLLLLLSAPSLVENLHVAWINSHGLTDPARRLPSKLPPLHQAVVGLMQEAFPTGSRIFFEDCNAGVPNVMSPFGDFRSTPVLQRLTGLEFIGGPYLKTRYVTNAIQVGDGLFFGQPWTTERFRKKTQNYGVTGIVCWSPAAVDFCRQHPQWCRPIFERSGFFGFAISDLPHPVRRAGGRWRAHYDRIEVDLPSGSTEPIILPYHYFVGMKSTPDAGLEPTFIDDDATPMIKVTRPATSFVITYR